MNWRTNHRVPEVTEWILGIGAQWYPIRCHNCLSFPIVLVRFVDVSRRWCPFCKVEDFSSEVL